MTETEQRFRLALRPVGLTVASSGDIWNRRPGQMRPSRQAMVAWLSSFGIAERAYLATRDKLYGWAFGADHCYRRYGPPDANVLKSFLWDDRQLLAETAMHLFYRRVRMAMDVATMRIRCCLSQVHYDAIIMFGALSGAIFGSPICDLLNIYGPPSRFSSLWIHLKRFQHKHNRLIATRMADLTRVIADVYDKAVYKPGPIPIWRVDEDRLLYGDPVGHLDPELAADLLEAEAERWDEEIALGYRQPLGDWPHVRDRETWPKLDLPRREHATGLQRLFMPVQNDAPARLVYSPAGKRTAST